MEFDFKKVTICGSEEATDNIVNTFLAGAPDKSVQLRISVVLFLGGQYSSDNRSTWKTSDSVEKESEELTRIIAKKSKVWLELSKLMK